MIDLRSCPFCGGGACIGADSVRGGWEYTVTCDGCLASMILIRVPDRASTEAKAVEVWNHRTPDFTWEDVDELRAIADSPWGRGWRKAAGWSFTDLADRIASLLPPREEA